MFSLDNWYFTRESEDTFIAHGNVRDNPKFATGKHIHTSVVKSIKTDSECNLICTTMSGSVYTLSPYTIFGDVSVLQKVDSYDLPVETFVVSLSDIVKVFNLPSDYVENLRAYLNARNDSYMREADSLLYNKELYIVMYNGTPAFSMYKDANGNLTKIPMNVYNVPVGGTHMQFMDADNFTLALDYEGGSPEYPELSVSTWSGALDSLRIRVLSPCTLLFRDTSGGVALSCSPSKLIQVPRKSILPDDVTDYVCGMPADNNFKDETTDGSESIPSV